MEQGMTLAQAMRAAARVGVGARSRLEWAVRFAAEAPDISTVQRRGELLGFAHPAMAAARGERIPLPSTADVQTIRGRFLDILDRLVRNGHAEIGLFRVQVGRSDAGAWLNTEPLTDDLEADAVAEFGRLLGAHGHRVKRCSAPKHVRAGDVPACGRWFVGRPNRSHCSSTCANLASTRVARFGRERETYGGFVIVAKPRQRAEGGWEAYFEYSGPAADVQAGPVSDPLGRSAFKTRDKVNEIAIRAAKAHIDATRSK
jgi:hypothetical protein